MKLEDYTPEMKEVNQAYLNVVNAQQNLAAHEVVTKDWPLMNAEHWLKCANETLIRILRRMEAERGRELKLPSAQWHE